MQDLVSRGFARRTSRLLVQVLAGLALAATSLPATAQNAVSDQVNELRNAFGLGKERPPIDFSERPPLVVPPTNNLPPPGPEETTSLGVNDPDIVARRKALADSRRPVPPSDPGAGATGLAARPYLVDPPSGMRDPDAVASTITTDTSSGGSKAETRRKRTHKRTPAPPAEQ